MKEPLPTIHFAPSVDSGPKNDHIFLPESPLKLLYTGKLLNEVPLILGINSHEGLYRSIRKLWLMVHKHTYLGLSWYDKQFL